MSLRIVRGEGEKEWVIDVLEGIGRRMGLAGAVVDEWLGGKGKGFWGVGRRLVQERGFGGAIRSCSNIQSNHVSQTARSEVRNWELHDN